MARSPVSARRRTAQLLWSYGLPLGVVAACYGFGARDWLGARTAGAEWVAATIASVAG
ncbi:hypothetical protein [Pseudokineococcus sp. 1T1Z-3]|uniref:hypothetical protein n=1 Tax=Pseudokineococcus sp. 1T1Z-3 TaxID=3132745 RepID=UPI0030AE5FA5